MVGTSLAVAYNLSEPKKEVYQWDKTFKIDTLLAKKINQKLSYTSFLMPIDGLIINLGNVKAGFGKRKEMFNALLKLKQSGKKIIVYSQNEISGSEKSLSNYSRP